jgi:hypothetical protein
MSPAISRCVAEQEYLTYTHPWTCFARLMDASGTARYGLRNWDWGMLVAVDQNAVAAARSSPSCR